MKAIEIRYDWVAVAKIWHSFQKGKISMHDRDRALQRYREQLSKDLNNVNEPYQTHGKQKPGNSKRN
jgi:hypothetical protein